ncbi:SNF2 chromatin remodeling protein [Cylindrobasidium torrendii FP15055 ss-10]|uniref:TATA-binding protein-associated factor mot1 n=1 Tax=Cylindrobasidium torrendii FP15055 ss-10 TaxID=1314674 RepID=A0A0D7B763_9AGAR|nr:SNF2 chromatin remodeling protein [Cylindrobasidium torrendii FP15055 ss-10]
MTSRLDRLLLLLDTGSSTSVRTTAAKQLAQLAAKSVIGDVAIQEDIKTSRHHVVLGDQSSWSELMSVVARIIPFLHSKSFETRTAASVALSHIFSLTPLWKPRPSESDDKDDVQMDGPAPSYPEFSVEDLVAQGKLLLASSGKEFLKPSGILSSAAEVSKARKEAMSRLGLEFLDDVADDLDLEKELADEDGDVPMDPATGPGVKSDTNTPIGSSPMDVSVPSPPASRSGSVTPAVDNDEPEGDPSAMSAREKNRLKRKRKQGTAFVHAPPTQATGSKYTAAPGASGTKARLVAKDEKSQTGSPANGATSKVVIDPSKGGAISAKEVKASKALEVRPGDWVWDGVVKVLEVNLFSPAWEVRHGAALALRELLKIQGQCAGMRSEASTSDNNLAHEKWCNDLSAKLLCVLVLDRFGDFVSDQVVAPVREMTSQTLASLLIHMPRRSVGHVHRILLQMVEQKNFIIPAQSVDQPQHPPTRGRPRKASTQEEKQRQHVWEVRHAGLLGVKYEVAVRDDLFTGTVVKSEDDEFDDSAKGILRDVVSAALLGLSDHDDDVRAVAASCLLPVAGHLVQHLPESLDQVLVVLWQCLNDMKDDLNSSVGAVMDLLGRWKLVVFEKVIELLGKDDFGLPLSKLACALFPFFRHTIPTVRLAVVETLQSFIRVESLPRDWISMPFLCLLFQNLVVEERPDIREMTLSTWKLALSVCRDRTDTIITPELILQWYAMVMTPLGVAIDASAFYRPVEPTTDGAVVVVERHNVDKHMLSQDLGLISIEITLKARVAAATALAHLIAYWPAEISQTDVLFEPILVHYIDSRSMLQKFLAAVIAEEWAHDYDALGPHDGTLYEQSTMARAISTKTLAFLQAPPPPAYHEMVIMLHKIHADCIALLNGFSTECKLPASSIPFLGNEVDTDGSKPGAFTITTAGHAANTLFTRLKDSLGRTKKKELVGLGEKRQAVLTSIERYTEVKAQNDIRVSAAFAAAFVAFKSAPDKVSPIVKGIMNGIKGEENIDLQTRSAVAVAAFIEFCTSNNITQPPEKIVKNLCTFLCQDTVQTPTFTTTKKTLKGILSFSAAVNKEAPTGKASKEANATTVTPEDPKSALSRRGAGLAFRELSARFGPTLLEKIPSMWSSMAGGLLSACPDGKTSNECDKLIDKEFGQDLIDSLSVLEAVVHSLHEDIQVKLEGLFPMLLLALRSKYAIVRQCTSRCMAAICDMMTPAAMRYVVEKVIPLLGDPITLTNRQGATELLYHIVKTVDLKALPYIVFLIVPVLGRMSDPDDDVRAAVTNTFASLVRMVPLEAGLPDPPGFPEELLKRRESERQFLTQLLDGTKVEQYNIPIPIKAELRPYQQDGVNWLAFLAKYQLHGILCDDMGLGKTLQSICILSSKHFERSEQHKSTGAQSSIPLPSLIVCPPTLTGHWYYEILKYADNLKPLLYVGNSRERSKLLSRVDQYDVVITSYEVVRNDIVNLETINWLYCILDEGHIIKNPKTKLTKAIKCIKAQHRLLLSGTPIQNNVLELWSLFDFLMPGFLGSESSFNERFSKPILANRDGKSKTGEAAALALEALHKQVLPFLLRRLKEDVLNDLPPKIIQDYYCELSDIQKKLYDEFSNSPAKQTAESAVQGGGKENQGHVFQSLQYLRKLCNHPALVLKDADAIASAMAKLGKDAQKSLDDISTAPKLQALKQLLTDCGIGGPGPTVTADQSKSELIDVNDSSGGTFSQHRVLIFCQMKQMLDIIENDLFKTHMPSVTYMRLDGGVDPNKRHNIVQTFNADPSIDVLLLTTHVGGLGLTLTGADTVIFVEHDWNPMKDLQAMDRAHRIGQKKIVNVYRLITKGTLEEKIMGLQRFKLNIANSVVTQQNSGLPSMDTDLVLDLFKRTTEEEDAKSAAKRKGKDTAGPITQKNALEGLDELPPEDEYQSLNLSSFMGSLPAR